MNNCDEYILSKYIDGQTTNEENKIIEKHLSDCGNCRKIYNDFKKIDDELKSFECKTNIKIPVDKIMSSINNKLPDHHRFVFNFWRIAACLLIVCNLFFIFYIFNLKSNENGNSSFPTAVETITELTAEDIQNIKLLKKLYKYDNSIQSMVISENETEITNDLSFERNLDYNYYEVNLSDSSEQSIFDKKIIIKSGREAVIKKDIILNQTEYLLIIRIIANSRGKNNFVVSICDKAYNEIFFCKSDFNFDKENSKNVLSFSLNETNLFFNLNLLKTLRPDDFSNI